MAIPVVVSASGREQANDDGDGSDGLHNSLAVILLCWLLRWPRPACSIFF
jgi:hypothetical protein